MNVVLLADYQLHDSLSIATWIPNLVLLIPLKTSLCVCGCGCATLYTEWMKYYVVHLGMLYSLRNFLLIVWTLQQYCCNFAQRFLWRCWELLANPCKHRTAIEWLWCDCEPCKLLIAVAVHVQSVYIISSAAAGLACVFVCDQWQWYCIYSNQCNPVRWWPNIHTQWWEDICH